MSRCPAGADDSDAVRTALREHYREDPAVNRETEEHESRFTVRMAGIVADSAERVGERGHRLFESYAVPARFVASFRAFHSKTVGMTAHATQASPRQRHRSAADRTVTSLRQNPAIGRRNITPIPLATTLCNRMIPVAGFW
jgi:hypothetical protein